MSANTGDKARYNKQRKRRVANRVRIRLLTAKLREAASVEKTPSSQPAE